MSVKGDMPAGGKQESAGLTSNRFIKQLFLISILIVLIATIVQSVFSLRIFEAELGPAIEGKAQAIGRVVAREVNRAVSLELPFEQLRGMEELLVASRTGHQEISYLVVGDAGGKLIYGSAQGLRRAAAGGHEISIPLQIENGPVYGEVHVGINEQHVRTLLGEVAIDIGTVLIVTLLITFEVLVILAALGIVLPIRALENLMRDYEGGRFDRQSGMRGGDELSRLGRRLDELGGRVAAAYAALRADYEAWHDSLRNHPSWKGAEGAVRDVVARFSLVLPKDRQALRLADFAHIRAPLTVFILSEELSRSFLPIFIHDISSGPLFGLSAEIVNSLPLSFYMLITAVFTPYAGSLVDKLGARRIFLLGCIPGVLGMLGTAFAQGVLDLLLWRGMAAIGYATSTIAAQGYLTRVASGDKRVQGMAIYVGAVMLAAICGTAVGGIIAEQIGFRATFLVSAGVAAIAALLAYVLLFDPPRDAAMRAAAQPGLRDIATLLARPLFGVLMVGVAMPAKVVLTGFLFYLMPLYLSGLGDSQSDIGRAMTAYFIIMAVGTKLVAKIADKVGKRRRFIILGGLAAGLGPLLLFFHQGFLPALIAAAAVGIGHALSTSPLMVLVTEVAARETPQVGTATVLSVFRVLERVGSVLGPFFAAALAAAYGYPTAMAGMGVVVLAGTLLFCVAFAFYRSAAKGAST